MPLFVNIKNPIPKQKAKEIGISWFTRRKKPYKSYKEKLQEEIKKLEFRIDDYEFKLFGDDPDYSHYRETDDLAHKMTVLRLDEEKVKLKELKQKLFNTKEDYDINEDYNSKIEKLKEYDGVINKDFEILVPSPNQIKSATDNTGAFSNEDDDIYHSSVTEEHVTLMSNVPSIASISDMLPLVQQPEFDALVASAEFETSCR